MAQAGYVDRMISALPADAADAEVLQAYTRAIGRQIRPPFAARHTPEVAAALITRTYAAFSAHRDGEVSVRCVCEGGSTRVMTVMRDQPFIVDTVRLALEEAGATYLGGFNAVFGVGRQADAPATISDAHPLESVILVEADGMEPAALEALQADLQGRLRLSRAMVADFQSMIDQVDACAYRFSRLADRTPDKADQLRETAEFLRWLLADNFVLMSATSGEGRLGFAQAALVDIWPEAPAPWESAEGHPVRVRKGRQDSPVHRKGRVDEIRIETPTIAGGPGRVLVLQGLFTYRAVTQPCRHVPLLRRTLAEMLRNQESKAGSYRYKGIANVFDSLPTEFLFTATTAQITRLIDRVLEAEQEHEVRAHITPSAGGDGGFVLAALPRQRWSDRLRGDIERLLTETTGGRVTDHGVFVGRYQTMLVHFYLAGVRPLDADIQHEVQAAIASLATPWETRLLASLTEQFGESRATELLAKYGVAFEPIYKQMNPPGRTARDIGMLEQIENTGDVRVDVYRDAKGRVNIRLYQAQDIILSDILPVLDDFGLIVVDQFADKVTPLGQAERTVDTFRLKGVWGVDDAEILERADTLVAGLRAVFEKHMPDDVLNRVLLRADIPWEAVDLLRAYNGYARQLGLRYTLTRVQELLLAQPALVRLLWEFFQAKFDPAAPGSRTKRVSKVGEAILDALRQVDDHDQDVAFRTLHDLMAATLRTSFYRHDRPEHYISFKIDCARVRQMPSPRLKYEIYVHHRDMEGVHLRGGDIARGGIRWSDREDYRREILDLATTQMTKNVLIVPEGAKGGFFMKHSKGTPQDRRRRADELYRIFMRGLLDLTDNIVDGDVVGPPGVVAHDGQDPYMVVAADKGTAHLSDTANGIAREYGFWLDDAYASGGSNGYDHKKVGITARGAWMTVRRHMRELGIDPVTEVFTCVGVGDPGGDVFGNGVVEHDKLKLVAAFNHLHIFLDPQPDVQVAYEERLRLFKEAKGWSHYDESKLGPGGGIFSRKAKSIPLSAEVKRMLGVLKDELPVDVVLRLLLRLNVDLLWNGGIGTYVKASTQTHQDAGDPANDHVRVNAGELRCRIIGEGGNLGFTQAGRIEYALGGGRINTDAIDNSGGVDMSDHEVNLKILLNPLVARGELGPDARNTLLEALTDEVADDVLANNDRHGRQLSLDVLRSARDPMFFSRTIDWVCQRSGVTRAALVLPSDDTLQRRKASQQGLTRPELAVLQAYVKMHVFKDLKAADPSVIPGFEDKVLGYFPARVRARYADDISKHMLHNSIGMTVVCGEVIGESGALFFPLLNELTGQPPETIARAWYRAHDLVGATDLLKAIRKSDAGMDARYRAWTSVMDAVQGLVAAWLAAGEAGPDKENLDGIKDALVRVGKAKGSELEARLRARAEAHVERGIPQRLADRIAALGELTTCREVALLNGGEERVSASLTRYLAIGQASRVLPAIHALEERVSQGGWDPVAIGILRNRYLHLMRALVDAVNVGAEVRLGIDRVATRLGRGELKELMSLMDHILGERPDIAALLVAEERVRAWAAERTQKPEA
jgi:glutamate dehydrogenase